MVDVAVLGAGLAGLTAARDLVRGRRRRHRARGARAPRWPRRGGRRSPTAAPCRPGGEVIGREHTAYRELVAELGLHDRAQLCRRARRDELGPGRGRVHRRRAALDERAPSAPTTERMEREFARLAATVDPDDPWSHPRGAAARSAEPRRVAARAGALRRGPRRHELASLSLSCDGPSARRCWRSCASTPRSPATGFYDLNEWEGLRVRRGVGRGGPARWRAELGSRIRLGAVVRADRRRARRRDGDARRRRAGRAPRRSSARSRPGRCARSQITGLSDARLASLRAQRHALAAKVVVAYEESFWQRGRAERPRRDRVAVRLHLAPGPGRAVAAGAARAACRRSWRRRRRRGARRCSTAWRAVRRAGAACRAAMLERAWGADPFTLGLHRRVGARRPDARRSAARHARAAVLRGRLRSLGRRLHGGRGPARAAAAAAALGAASPA